jgi:multidrug resistance efflux pump
MRRGFIVLLIVAVVSVALAAGWWSARNYPQQVIDFLVDGGLEASRAEGFVTTLRGQEDEAEEQILIASGSIEGDEYAIVSEFGGRIVGLYADEGAEVEAGQVLVELDSSLLLAQVAEAEAAVAAAQANLASIEAGTHPAEILAAQAGLRQTIAERNAAHTAWQDALVILDNPQAIDAQIVEAQSAVNLAAAQIELAEAQLAQANTERDEFRAQGSMEQKYLYAAYGYQVEAAHAALDAASEQKSGAAQVLAALRALRANPLAVASQVNMAEAQYEMAAAAVGVAKARYEEAKAGPTPEEILVAEAQVTQAETAVKALQTQIDMLSLGSPIRGLVTSCSAHAGEAALAGATLLTVANLDEVTLTIYVPEDELERVYLGQTVDVEVDSYPGRVFSGTVTYISQQAEFTPKNVQTEKERVNMVFAVKVVLPNPGHLLKPGMPADAILREY